MVKKHFLTKASLNIGMAKELALTKLGDFSEKLNKKIQQEIGERGIARKISNEEPLNEAEKEFLGNLSALSYEASQVLKTEEEDLEQALEDLERVIELKENIEEQAMKNIENGLKSFEGHLTELNEDLEGRSESVQDAIDKLQHDQEGILQALEEMIELDRKLSEQSDLDRVLLRLVKHSSEAGSFLQLCGFMYENRTGNVPSHSDDERWGINDAKIGVDMDEVSEVGDIRNPSSVRDSEFQKLVNKRKGMIRKWAAEAEGEAFASKVAERMKIGDDDDVEEIENRVKNAFTGHSFMETGEKVEELLEIEKNLDRNVRSRVREYLKEDSSLKQEISEIKRKMGKYYSEKHESLDQDKNHINSLEKILRSVKLTKRVLNKLERFDENDLEEEAATEKFIEGRITAENFESVIKKHTDNRQREFSLKRLEEKIDDARIHWEQQANHH